MSITEMARSLTAVAKTGAKTNIENEKVSRLAPVVIMAVNNTDEVKMAKIKVREGVDLNKALKSCLKHYNAHAYSFVREGQGTEFVEALLLAKGNFNILSVEDRYGVVSLHTVTKGIPSVLTSRSIVKAKEEGRILSDWEDYLIDEKSEFYTTEW